MGIVESGVMGRGRMSGFMTTSRLRKTVLKQQQEIERLQKQNDELVIAWNRQVNEMLDEKRHLRSALEGLLEDTQHREHDCGDDDCPVKIAREALRDE